jgi:hypothetical protein
MHATAVVVVVVVGGFGCFSTARYDDAHVQRVANINARYEAENRREAEQYASRVAALDQLRAQLLPIPPGSCAPEARIDAGDAIDEQARALAQHQAQARDRLDAERQGEIQASAQQRTSEIASGRAVRRARLQAAHAFTALEQGPISARQPCVGATGAQLLSRVGECRVAPWVPGRVSSSSHSAQPSSGGAPAARR